MFTVSGIVLNPQASGIAIAGHAQRHQAAQETADLSADVDSRQGWQFAGISITIGERVILQVDAGSWTSDPGAVALNPGTGNSQIPAGPGYPLPGAPDGSLVGRIGGYIFEIGPGAMITAHDSGQLLLRIDDMDDGLYDNQGLLTVRIAVVPPEPANVPRQVVPIYPLGNAGLPPNLKVRFAWEAFPHAVNYAIHIWMVKQKGITLIKPSTPVELATLVYRQTKYTWNDAGFLAGAYQYSLMPLDAMGNGLAPWSSPVQINIYNS